jgi:transposase-like protein
MTIADVIAAQTGHDGTVAAPDGPRAGRPRRRTFTAEYKLRILEEYENAPDPQHRNALLRREGIYTSTISEWRRARDKAASGSIPERKPGRPARDAAEAENERLRKENEKLAAELARTKAALEVAGKAHALRATRGRTRLSERAGWRADRCRSAA